MHATTTTRPAPTRLRVVLGQWGTAAVSVGVMAPTLAMAVVGPGPAALVGRAAPLAFAAAGLLVLLVGAGFFRLSAQFAGAGSVYAFVGGAVGPRSGAFTGWVMLGTYLVFPWVSVAGVSIFAGQLLGRAGLGVDWYVLALGGWAVVGLLAAGGLRPAVRALAAVEIAAVVLILALMGVVVAALAGGRAPRGQVLTAQVFALPPAVPAGAVVLATTVAFLAYCGFEAAGSMGEEARSPRRAVPRAMAATVVLGLAFYTACVAVQVLGFGADPAGVAAYAASTAPLADLATAYAGPGLATALDAAALVSAVGAGLGCATVAVRMLYAMGRDAVLPPVLGRLSARTCTPSVALVVELAAGLAMITGFRLAGATPGRMFFVLATIGVLHLLVMYAMTDVAAARLAGRRAAALLPALGAVVAAAVLVLDLTGTPPGLLAAVAGWLALGTVPAVLAGRRATAGRRRPAV